VAASLDRARGEPPSARPDIAHYAGVLSAGRRIVAGTHALASHLRDASTQVGVPAAATIAAELDQAMSALVVSLRTHSPLDLWDTLDLRGSQHRLAVATAAGQTAADRRGAILAALLDQIVDSIDTAADLLGAER
jgi:monomeric isocitrate dehydrogenase